MKKLNTKLGIFYINKEDDLFALLDSDKQWIGNFETEEELEPINTFDSIQDFVDNYMCDNAIWGQSPEEVWDIYYDVVGDEYMKEYNITFEDFQQYHTLRVGTTYFVLNYDMI